MERLELEVDATTAAYLRRACLRRGGSMAAAAAAQLAELARTDEAHRIAAWTQENTDLVEALVEESEAAFASS